MKNTFKILVIIALVIIISGCTKKTASQSESETDLQSEVGEIVIDFTGVDESDYAPSSVHLFIPNSEYPRLKFTTNVTVRDFSWLSISPVWDENDDIGWDVTDVLYLIDKFLPQKPFVVSWVEVGIFPNSGISYLDKNGERKYFMLMSNDYGGDPEEEGYDGGLSLSEFTPVSEFFLSKPAIIGQYRNEEDSDADLILDIAENSYKLNVKGALYTGTYEVTYSYETWYVYLPNIKWAHNWIRNFDGIIDIDWDNIDWDKLTDEETYGIDLWIEEGEVLVFQNRGNPMAPYEIFDVIDEKFVRLIPINVQSQRNWDATVSRPL
ncbi:hypothetical protein [Treponema sp. R80B11-R83G3]